MMRISLSIYYKAALMPWGFEEESDMRMGNEVKSLFCKFKLINHNVSSDKILEIR